MMDRKSWGEKLQLVKSTWLTFRPDEKVERSWLKTKEFGVTFFRSLGEGIEVRSRLSGWQIEAREWFVRVRVTILDRRIAELRAEVLATADTSGWSTFDFDVLAAAAAIEGRKLEPAPLVEPAFSDDAARRLVKDFSDKVDRIWTFAGGFTVSGVETLSIWLIRRRIGVPKIPPSAVVGVVCTAFIYGERELSRELVREYETFLVKRRRVEVVNEETRAIHADLSKKVARLRALLS
jgi:hypothetical protein